MDLISLLRTRVLLSYLITRALLLGQFLSLIAILLIFVLFGLLLTLLIGSRYLAFNLLRRLRPQVVFISLDLGGIPL